MDSDDNIQNFKQITSGSAINAKITKLVII